MRLNNKGFATTAIMYSILALIIMLLLGSLAYLASRKKVLDKIKNDTYNEINEILGPLETKEFEYTGNYQVFTASASGYYRIEAWGAQGGGTGHPGGNGAYTDGYVYLNIREKLYIYVGNYGYKPVNASNPFNGGGVGDLNGTWASSHSGQFSGGGATDIRFFGNTTPTTSQLAWDSELGLNSRIMVAAGGGSGNDALGGVGGVGGNLVGGAAYNPNDNTPISVPTQIAGSSFGKGQASGTYNTDGGADTGSGGGGYYGGYRGVNTNTGGSGGSSFISGYAGVNAITSSTSRVASNNTIHYSGKYFLGGIMKTGNEFMPTYDGESAMLGNSGNGHAKISYVGKTITRKDTRLNGVRYIKICGSGNSNDVTNRWNEVQAIYNGVNIAKGKTITLAGGGAVSKPEFATDGDIGQTASTDSYSASECAVLDLGSAYDLDEVAVWNNWYPSYANLKNPAIYVSSDNSNWIILSAEAYKATSQGKRISAYTVRDTEFNYTGSSQTFVAPTSGYYKLEAWGAQGGMSISKGAYTSGYIYLNQNTSLYVYVGEGNNTTVNSTTFNGGTGNAGGYGAAGATDFRLTSGAWDNATSINSRIMVAAGSGSGSGNKSSLNSGAGGTLYGLAGGGTQGGTQTSVGAVQSTSYTASAFGVANGGCAGGNGYYPGGGATCANGAGGGSSFISGYAGVNAITSASSTAASGNTKHYSGKYFLGGVMKAGNEEVPTYSDTSLMTGNSGHGHAKVTYVGSELPRLNTRLNNVRYIKDCANGSSANAYNHWVELQAIKDGINLAKGKTVTGITAYSGKPLSRITDADLNPDNYSESATANVSECITLDLGATYDLDEIAVWHYWKDNRAYDHTMSVSSDNSSWVSVMTTNENETSNGMHVNAYTINDTKVGYARGGLQIYTVPVAGRYKIELWGATGGSTTGAVGGRGAYTSGNITLNKNDVLYLTVGNNGVAGQTATSGSTPAGGFNGGANGYINRTTCTQQAASGGGATDVRISSGSWDNETSLNSRIMVAAGGGGAFQENCATNDNAIIQGGGAGGLYGLTPSYISYTGFSALNPTGGTQVSGGSSLDAWTSTSYSTTYSGTFGKGATGSQSYSGGGGGYWGGASGTWQPGAGGSSFISGYAGVNAITSSSSRIASNNTKHYSGKYFVGGTMQADMNAGKGKAQITYLSKTSKKDRFNQLYQRVEYLQSTGTQYIDTGIKLDMNNDKFEVDFQANDDTGNYFIAGSGWTDANYMWVYNYKGGSRFAIYAKDTGGSQRSALGFAGPDAYRHKVVYEAKKLLVDDSYKSTIESYTFGETTYNFSLFNAINSTGYFAKTRIYSFKMWKSGLLVRNMIPCLRKSDGVLGFYDTVEDKFYTNAGTGVFTSGPVINLENVRYVKDCTSENTVNAGNHWVELQVIKDGVNIAKGKTPSGATTSALVTDGDITTANWVGAGTGTGCITIDLGAKYDIDEIAVWHYFGDVRYYKNHVMSVSDDNANWRNVITSTELETSQGQRVSAWNQ